MNLQRLVVYAILTAVVLTAVPSASAQPEYQTYERPKRDIKWFRIKYGAELFRLTVYRADTIDNIFNFPPASLSKLGSTKMEPNWRLTDEMLTVGKDTFDLNLITRIRVAEDPANEAMVELTFYRALEDDERARRTRMGNVVNVRDDYICGPTEFVRGFVLAGAGDIKINGEVNEDVISLAGDIDIGPTAVVRGDVVALTGRIKISREASVYGDTFAPDVLGRSKVAAGFKEGVSTIEVLDYNRVDGLTLGLGAQFVDSDSLIPSLWFQASYALESERGRYRIGFEQVLWRDLPIAVGAEGFRELANEDDWIVDPALHFVYPLLANKDYRDYYEAEGGRGWVSARPLANIEVELGYQFEETRYFDAHPLLWSLFGGDEEFRPNYSTAPPQLRQEGIEVLNGADNGFLYVDVGWDTRFVPAIYDSSAWHVTGELEWSTPDLDSDYDYRRYRIMARRYQTVHERGMLLMRGVFGGSDGYLPMHKRWYIGGLSTVEGYEIKEFVGTRFWMANGEYRFSFDRYGLAGGLYYDVAQVANDEKLDGDIEVRQSVGVAAYVGDLRIGLAQRLDGASDDEPRLWVRLSHTF